MKLINEKIKERIEQFPLYSQDGKRKEAQVIAKFFLSQGAWTWYILEGNLSEDTLYGITVSGDGGCEYGYISIKELESLRSVLGLGVEVDKYFEPCKVGDLKDGYVERFIESLYGKKIIDKNRYRTDVFEVVDEFPADYSIWNIGRENFNHECFIPLAQRVSNNKKELEYYQVKTDTLKALKVESEELALFLMKYAHKVDSVNSSNFDQIVKEFKEGKQ